MEHKRKISGFFINLMGIILGITITFGINSLWQKREENKKTKELLILVRNELTNNKLWFQKQEKAMKEQNYSFVKILEAHKNLSNFPEDTLKYYIEQFAGFSLWQLTTSAWQTFQNSEMIQKITNKELVFRLTDCYYGINLAYDFLMKNYWDKKLEALPVFEKDTYSMLNAIVNNKKSFYFLMYMDEDSGFMNIFPQMDAIIDFTVALLDKYGDFRYDMDEKDKEYVLFIKERMDSVQNYKVKKQQNEPQY